MTHLRDYQAYARMAWWEWIVAQKGNPLLLYPTGVGKSVIFADLITWVTQTWPATRSIMLTHSKHLVQQNFKELKQYWPMAPVGIYCDGLGQKVYWQQITYGSIQTCYNLASLFGHIDHIWVDEADLISPDEKSMYQKFFAGIKAINPRVIITGSTATGWRQGQGMLWEGPNPTFHGAAVDACSTDAFNWFLDEGYLVPPVAKRTEVQYDTTGIKTVAGEYNQKQAEAAVNKRSLNERVVEAMCAEFQYRNCGIVFGQGIAHVKELTDIFNYNGIKACCVHSKDPDEVDKMVERYKAGEFEMMINNGILTTGFNHPYLDFMGINRLTKSSRLFVQMLGRGTRPYYAPGFDLLTREGRLESIANSHKQYCLTMDFADNGSRLGMINAPRIPKPKGVADTPGDAPVRICDNCGTYNHASAPACTYCGEPFPRREKLFDVASTRALVKRAKGAPPPTIMEDPIYEPYTVDYVTYEFHHARNSSTPCVKVAYQCALRTFFQYIFPEGNPGQRGQFKALWIERGGDPMEVPQTVAEALAGTEYLIPPTKIVVHINRKHPSVVSYEYAASESPATSQE